MKFENSLIPKFTERDKSALRAYDDFSEKYYKIINEKFRLELKDDPIIGQLIRSRTPEEHQMQRDYSRKLQKEAIQEDKWENYSRNLFEQGTAYAKAGLSFSDWFSIVKIYRDYAQPLILEELQRDTKRLGQVLEGLNKMIDYALNVIAESYLVTKNNLISDRDEKLKVSEERFKALFENSSDHIYLIDKLGTIQYINHVPAGLQKNEVLGSNLYDYQPKKHRKKIEKAINKVIQTGKPTIFDTEMKSTQDIQYYSCSASPVFKDGAVDLVAIIARNVTDKILTNKQIRELNDDLERKVEQRTVELQSINQELESFSYTVSHDLRAPIRAIDGFTKVLLKKLDGKLDEREQHYLQVIIENTGKMGQLIDDLLAFSRMGRLEKKMTLFDMDQLSHQVFQEMTQNLDTSRIILHGNSLPRVRADREMIKVVLSNLIGNAIKFSSTREKAEITIEAEENDQMIIYSVQDNGVGFEMEYIDKLFGIFQRLHSDEEFEGTGVGLAIVQRIIHRHGGEVWATSVLNQNATFYFSLPKYTHP